MGTIFNFFFFLDGMVVGGRGVSWEEKTLISVGGLDFCLGLLQESTGQNG